MNPVKNAVLDNMLTTRFSSFRPVLLITLYNLMLLGTMLIVSQGSTGWAWGYAVYSVVNSLSVWLIMSGRI